MTWKETESTQSRLNLLFYLLCYHRCEELDLGTESGGATGEGVRLS